MSDERRSRHQRPWCVPKEPPPTEQCPCLPQQSLDARPKLLSSTRYKLEYLYHLLLPSCNVALIPHPPSQQLLRSKPTAFANRYHLSQKSHIFTPNTTIPCLPRATPVPNLQTARSLSMAASAPAPHVSIPFLRLPYFFCQPTNKSIASFYTTVKTVPSSRGGAGTVVIQSKSKK